MMGTRRPLGLADMTGLPMSAGWYWEIGYLRTVLRHLASQHAAAIKGRRLSPHELERHEVVQRHATCAIEHVDRLQRTMEAAGVRAPDD